ncbi:unnamed protein product [Adineta ricciae]|nr:unnamed protein product [Adineta ricciae]
MKEVRKHHGKGLESIQVTSLSTQNRDSLVVEFVCTVSPQHNRAINIAIRRALVSDELQQALEGKHKCN